MISPRQPTGLLACTVGTLNGRQGILLEPPFSQSYKLTGTVKSTHAAQTHVYVAGAQIAERARFRLSDHAACATAVAAALTAAVIATIGPCGLLARPAQQRAAECGQVSSPRPPSCRSNPGNNTKMRIVQVGRYLSGS